MKKNKIKAIKNFLKVRDVKIETEFQYIDRYDYEDIFTTLNRILDENEDCCFDLTGGKELVLAAMGEISASKNIPLVQFNIRTGNMICVKNYDCIIEEVTSMSIEESVALSGGTLVPPLADEFKWELTKDFRNDIETMWKINGKSTSEWNKFSKVLAKYGREILESGNLSLKKSMSKLDETEKEDLLNPDILDELRENKIVLDYSDKNNTISFRIKNKQVFECIIKAGNILELYTYMVATEIAEELPGFYDDIKMGVKVDWDGVINERTSKIKDTTNEIDVFMMRDLVPVFISCKNGNVGKEALYELHTVAEKFGGEYAKKVLMATFITHDPVKKEFLKQRARDMNIEIIENIDVMSKSEFKREMKRRVK